MQDDSVFNFYPPKNKYIGVLSIPHSGQVIPKEFVQYLTKNTHAWDQDVDFKVNELVDIEKLTENGIAVIVANIHRVCVDLNRPPEAAVLNWKKNSMQVELVTSEPTEEDRKQYEMKYHAPYFEMLKAMINDLATHQKGIKSLIDLHSMPTKPTEYHLKVTPNQPLERPDFCVSDIEGISCEKEYIDFTCTNLSKFSNDVTKNIPYYGGHITRYIHATYENINNIQIEIKRGIYMDEETRELVPNLVDALLPNLTDALIDTFKKFAD